MDPEFWEGHDFQFLVDGAGLRSEPAFQSALAPAGLLLARPATCNKAAATIAVPAEQ
jgi:hypothetical protein